MVRVKVRVRVRVRVRIGVGVGVRVRVRVRVRIRLGSGSGLGWGLGLGLGCEEPYLLDTAAAAHRGLLLVNRLHRDLPRGREGVKATSKGRARQQRVRIRTPCLGKNS